MLTGSRLVQFTANFVQSFAALGDLMRIHSHAATFDAELEARLRSAERRAGNPS
jgi:phage regulator Rha-like protein